MMERIRNEIVAETNPSPASLYASSSHDVDSTTTAVAESGEADAPQAPPTSSGAAEAEMPLDQPSEELSSLPLPQVVSECSDLPEELTDTLAPLATVENPQEDDDAVEIDQDRACTPPNIYYDGDEPAPPPQAVNRPDEPLPAAALSTGIVT